jgi:hypothetical protein
MKGNSQPLLSFQYFFVSLNTIEVTKHKQTWKSKVTAQEYVCYALNYGSVFSHLGFGITVLSAMPCSKPHPLTSPATPH